MLVLGVHDGHDTSVALVRDGVVVAAVAEERLRRQKNHDSRRSPWGMPDASLAAALELAGARPEDVELVALPLAPLLEDGRRLLRDEGASPDAAVAFLLLAVHKTWRIGKLRLFLWRAGVRAPRVRLHHHLAHGWSAFGTSGERDAWVVTLDGKGDGLSGLVARASDAGIEVVREIAAGDSLGLAYSALTSVLGFRMDEDEGKTGALAAGEVVDDGLRRLFDRLAPREGAGWRVPRLRTLRAPLRLIKMPTASLARSLGDVLAGRSREELAAGMQDLLERRVRGLVEDLGGGVVVAAGGVFANVGLNRAVAEARGVERLYVHPAMGDAGLAVGAALYGASRGGDTPVRLEHGWLGPAPDPAEIASIAASWAGRVERPQGLEVRVAALLAEGASVAVCRGRMEYGPRALGHRSVLRRPDDVAGAAALNRALGRDPVMPFAPAARLDRVDACVVAPSAARPLLPWMTVAVPATERFARDCPAVVHRDGTSRLQAVDPAVDPWFAAVLGDFEERTGLPALLNTSFNRHREPIVASARDAFRAWRATGLDALVLGETLLLA